MHFYFVRHGESEANLLKEFSNKGLKHGLSPKGREQVNKLAEKLKVIPFHAIYSSPLLRALQTAEIISGKLNMQYAIATELVEFDVGILEGKSDQESWDRYGKLIDEWFVGHLWDMRIEEGESYNDIKNRVLPFISRLKEEHPPEANVLLVGHGGTFRCIFPLVLSNIDFQYSYVNQLSNTEYIHAATESDTLKCLSWGDRVLE